ncbi:MAG: hypothetical protein J6M60_07060 [Clostridia bacterium]|nr:hypothetical protein [Clostridia bacterium]
MNQILYVNTEKQKGGPLDIKVVLRIFAVVIIVFGMILIGKSAYAMFNKAEDVSTSIPSVEITQQGSKLKINVTHDKQIDKITYMWNNQSPETVLQGKGRNNIEELIDLPLGTNILNLKVIDINGKTTAYNKQYVLENGDVTAPEIEFEQDGSKVKIIARDETALDYMEYYWNEEDPTKVSATNLSPKQVEERVQILKGVNTLYIVAVDKAGNKTVKDQPYKGATKPTVNLTLDGTAVVMKISDAEGIQRLEYELNGTLYSTDPQNTGEPLYAANSDNSDTKTVLKEFEYKQELASGANKLVVRVYNISGLMTETTMEPTI